jgi:hypothetical protein
VAESDRRRLREGVRLTVDLRGARAIGPLVAVRTGPPDGDPPGGHRTRAAELMIGDG